MAKITEAICRRIIETERLDLNGSMLQRQDYTGAARAFAGTLAADWLLDKAVIAEAAKLLSALVELQNDGRLELEEATSDWVYATLERCQGRRFEFARVSNGD